MISASVKCELPEISIALIAKSSEYRIDWTNKEDVLRIKRSINFYTFCILSFLELYKVLSFLPNS